MDAVDKYVLNQDRYVKPGARDLQSIGELLPGVLERGKREHKPHKVHRFRLSPTNSERMNRALKELGPSAFKIHTLLWKWRGAPSRGLLPFFTIHSLAKFCGLSRPTVRSGLLELTQKGWIEKLGYNVHEKNELYRLTPVREVRSVHEDHVKAVLK